MYKFEQLDPRSVAVAKEKNDAIFASGAVLGIEVSIPDLAERCEMGNIDPQHSDGNAETAAIEASLKWELPKHGAVLATVRPDSDSIGAMAVLAMRAEGVEFSSEILERIAEVARFDSTRGEWPGVRPLPNRKPAKIESFVTMLAMVGDFKKTVESRVVEMQQWLENGLEPTGYRDQLEKDRLAMANALESGEIQIVEVLPGKLASVVSTHRSATGLGYHRAPVLVVLNPKFQFQGGKPHKKFTVCQFETGYCDISCALAELDKLEPGWGGSPNIGGSPQGSNSNLTIEQVVEVVAKYLK
jgi:hypothetical protein